MTELPKTLEDAIAQARVATLAAIADGYSRLQVELLFPELKLMPVALQYIATFEQLSSQLNSEEAPAAALSFKVFFPDAGAAALARRDWGDVPFKIVDVGTGKFPQEQIQPEDEAFLFVAPSPVEVAQVEKLCEEAGDRPVVLLNPRLQAVAIVGIGYAGRQLRDRFLNNFETCYHLRPLDGAALFRCYPSSWQVWLETGNDYKLIAELPKRPFGEELEEILAGTTKSADSPPPKKPGLFTNLERFLRTLSR